MINSDVVVYPKNLMRFIAKNNVTEKENTFYGACTCTGECISSLTAWLPNRNPKYT